MELIISFIFIAYIIKAIIESNKNSKPIPDQENNPWDRVTSEIPKKSTRVDSPKAQVQKQNSQWEKLAKENIEKARQRASQKLQEIEKSVLDELNSASPNKSAMKQVMEGRMEANNTTIVERARRSTNDMKNDVTLETLEKEHNHSERVSAAEHHHEDDVIPESMLGNVEDLLVKGYDGNLCFERDFVGEAMDMISRFTVPSDMPDFQVNE